LDGIHNTQLFEMEFLFIVLMIGERCDVLQQYTLLTSIALPYLKVLGLILGLDTELFRSFIT
jgi:hypothetical protein